MQNNSNVYIEESRSVDGSSKVMEKEFADNECFVGDKINNWSHFFADRAAKCIEYGLLDDGLRFLDLALTEKYLELLKQVTEKVEKKRDRLLSTATFDKRSLSKEDQSGLLKAKL